METGCGSGTGAEDGVFEAGDEYELKENGNDLTGGSFALLMSTSTGGAYNV